MLVVNTRMNLKICKSRSIFRYIWYVGGMKKTVNVYRIFVENLFESDYLENSIRNWI